MKKQPMDRTPDVHDFQSPPQTVHDIVNMYGTYNVQRTVHTDNLFPMIGQGLPKGWRDMQLGKKDLSEEE